MITGNAIYHKYYFKISDVFHMSQTDRKCQIPAGGCQISATSPNIFYILYLLLKYYQTVSWLPMVIYEVIISNNMCHYSQFSILE